MEIRLSFGCVGGNSRIRYEFTSHLDASCEIGTWPRVIDKRPDALRNVPYLKFGGLGAGFSVFFFIVKVLKISITKIQFKVGISCK